MKILGHSSYRQIEKTYGHLLSEMLKSTMKAANELLDEPAAVRVLAEPGQRWLH